MSPPPDAWSEQTQLSHPASFLEASSSGRTAGFDPAYRGSNPCASAIIHIVMIINKIFSTPVWQTQLNFDAAIVAAKCLDMMRSGFPNRVISNRGGWQSEFLKLSEIEEFAELNSEIERGIVEVSNSIADGLKLKRVDAWININKKNHFNTAHNHSSPGACLSSVVYIQVDEETGKIFFRDLSSPYNFYPHMLPYKRNFFLAEEKIQPTVGMMLTFPAWIHHGVERSASDLTRISIAFNISNIRVGER